MNLISIAAPQSNDQSGSELSGYSLNSSSNIDFIIVLITGIYPLYTHIEIPQLSYPHVKIRYVNFFSEEEALEGLCYVHKESR